MSFPKLSRRQFVKYFSVGGASFLASPWVNKAFADQGLLAEGKRNGLGDREAAKGALTNWGRMKFRTTESDINWQVHPQGDINLVMNMNESTTVNVDESWYVADVYYLDQMTKFPMLFMHAETPPDLAPKEEVNLVEYIKRGGFLYAEDCVIGYKTHGLSGGSDLFFQATLQLLTRLFPEGQVIRLPLDHPIFHIYFDLPDGQPHMQGKEYGGHGLILDGRLAAYVSPSDAHCGWSNTSWFGKHNSRQAFKMGTNVYLYAMMH